MSNEQTIRRFPDWMTAAPWLMFLLIGAVFFYTGHDIYRSRYIVERGVEEFNPTGEEAELLLQQFQQGSPAKAVAYLILGGCGALILGVQLSQRRLRVNGLLGGLAVFFVLWASMSLAWADDYAVTLNKVAILAMMCLGALAGAQRFREEDLLLLLLSCTGAYLLIGVAAEIALGSFRPWVAGYRFSGTVHPNGQGLNCALLFLCAYYMRRMDEPRKKWWTALTVAALVFLFLTKSRTPIGLVLITMMAFWAMRAPLPQKVFLVALAGMVLCAVLVLGDTLFPALSEVLRFGRTDVLDAGGGTTFKGRLELWRVCWPYIADHPFLGYGYNSFWTVDNTFDTAEAAGWIAGSAHSIYVDTFLGLGFVGLFSFLGMFALAIRRLYVLHAATAKPVYGFLLTVLLFSLAHGLLESTFIFPAIYSFFTIATVAYLAFGVPEEVPVEPLPVSGKARKPVTVS